MKTRENLFRGVNPYLQSLLQTPGTAEHLSSRRSFHGQYIINMTNHLNTHLPAQYTAVNEQSLQLWGESDGGILKQTRIPDVAVYREFSGEKLPDFSGAVAEPTLEITIDSLLEAESPDAVLIFHDEGSSRLVLRIEVLSPSNKGKSEHADHYRSSRWEALRSGVPLVEVDFLHESVSPVEGLPHYPHEKNSAPFYIALTRPAEARTAIYSFYVEMPAPTVNLPLAGEDKYALNFDALYQFTYETGWWGKRVDYTDLPVRFSRYHPDDQQRIQTRREEILKAPPPKYNATNEQD